MKANFLGVMRSHSSCSSFARDFAPRACAELKILFLYFPQDNAMQESAAQAYSTKLTRFMRRRTSCTFSVQVYNLILRHGHKLDIYAQTPTLHQSYLWIVCYACTLYALSISCNTELPCANSNELNTLCRLT